MVQWLKQSTAFTLRIGPFVDSTDGFTAKTGLTIAQADYRLSKAGGAFAQKSETTSGAHDENGYYTCIMNTTDTGTLGTLRVAVIKSTALPVWHDFMVVPAQVWDSYFGADTLQVDIAQFGNSNGTFSGGRPEVNTTHLAGTSQTGRDIGASVIAASVTGLTASDVGAIKTKTDFLPSATAGAAGGVFIAGTNAATTVTTSFTTTFTGNLTGSVGSVTGAVGSVTGAVGSVTGNVGGNVTGTVGSVVGAVGSVTGNVGGNVTGTVASVVGAVGSVTGNVGGNLTGTIGGLTAAALKKFFDTDSTTTYASAVAGSVVKEIASNAAGSGLDAAATRAALGMASANLDTQLGVNLTNTDALWDLLIGTTPFAGGLTFTQAMDGLPVTSADALLDRNMATGVDSGSPTVRTPRQALRFLRNKWAVSAGTLTVRKEDDTTASWTSTVSTDAAAVPIVGNDPA